jgi:crotonobetainyl-CoA:carnitine CoA-transferase CaiB-like acyl-CoA transferase
MASGAPLVGVRIIESSMLGPAEMGGLLADLGAEVIKVEPPQGDYGRQMTWPIIKQQDGRARTPLSLHVNRASTRRGRPAYSRPADLPRLVRDADVVIEPYARCPRETGPHDGGAA